MSTQKCEICKKEDAIMSTPLPLCKLPEGDKHRINLCSDCYGDVDSFKCPKCVQKPEQKQERKQPPAAKKEHEEIKATVPTAAKQDPKPAKEEKHTVLEAISDKSKCFICHGDEPMMLTVQKCHTRSHEVPCCAGCIEKLEDCPCPVCEALSVEPTKDQHLMIFSEDVVIVGMLLEDKTISWSIINSVESVSGLQFVEFPQQGACAALQYFPYQAVYIGGYDASRLDEKDRFASNLASPRCYFLLFSGFDYLTVDAGPTLQEGRFLHQSVSYYDRTRKLNVVFAIGGMQYVKGKKTWLRSCEMLELAGSSRWTAAPSLNVGRSEFAAGVVGNGVLYVVGGFSGTNKMVNSDIEFYEPGKTWEILKVEMPTGYRPLAAQCLCVDARDNSIWILGGADGRNVYPNVYRLATKERKMEEMPPMLYPRGAAVCAMKEGTIIVTGGFCSQLQTEVFDSKEGHWALAPESYPSLEEFTDPGSKATTSEHVLSTKTAILHKFI